MQPRRDTFGGRDDETQIGLLRLIEGRRDRHEDDVDLAQLVVVGRCPEAARLEQFPKAHFRDVHDRARPLAQCSDALLIDVDTDDAETGLSQTDGEWKADVSASDHGDLRLLVEDAVTK